jgi:hypothetical protein
MLARAPAPNLPDRTLRYNLAAETCLTKKIPNRLSGCRRPVRPSFVHHGNIAVIYALPCHDCEHIICSWNKEEDAKGMAKVMGA